MGHMETGEQTDDEAGQSANFLQSQDFEPMTTWLLIIIFSTGYPLSIPGLPDEVTCHNVARNVRMLAMQNSLGVVYACTEVAEWQSE